MVPWNPLGKIYVLVHLLCPLPGTISPHRLMLLELSQRSILRYRSMPWVCGSDLPGENEALLWKGSSAGLVCACVQTVPFRNGAEQSYLWFVAGCPPCSQTCWLHQQDLSSQSHTVGGMEPLQLNEWHWSESKVTSWVCWDGKATQHQETFATPAQTLEYVPSSRAMLELTAGSAHALQQK